MIQLLYTAKFEFTFQKFSFNRQINGNKMVENGDDFGNVCHSSSPFVVIKWARKKLIEIQIVYDFWLKWKVFSNCVCNFFLLGFAQVKTFRVAVFVHWEWAYYEKSITHLINFVSIRVIITFETNCILCVSFHIVFAFFLFHSTILQMGALFRLSLYQLTQCKLLLWNRLRIPNPNQTEPI